MTAVRRATLVLLALALALLAGPAGRAQDGPTPSTLEALLAPLPAAVRDAALDAATRAAADPEVALARVRLEADAARSGGRVAPEGSLSWRPATGTASLDVGIRVAWLDPAAERDANADADRRDRWRLDRDLATRAAVEEVLVRWAHVDAARRQLALLDTLAALPPPADPAAADVRARLLEARAQVRFDARHGAATLAAELGRSALPALPEDAWRAWFAAHAAPADPARTPAVRRADAALRSAERALADAEAVAARPTVTARGGVGVARSSGSWGATARIAVDVGAPPGWPAAGTATLGWEGDAPHLSVDVRAAPAAGTAVARAEVARAQAARAEALAAAEAAAGREAFERARAVAARRAGPWDGTWADAERALGRAAWRAREVELRAARRLAALPAPAAPGEDVSWTRVSW
ncbi:MAG: hypothetical protein RI554_00780 [Trueperaceae bacterium]|nr:hypothetical protein [Trueperaceae bacterium]